MSKENPRQLGTAFDYMWYFEKRRNRFYKQKKKHAKEFIEKLEVAIVIAVRMTSGSVGMVFNLAGRKPMERNKLCNVCQASVSFENQGTIVYFKAKKVKRPGEYSTLDGFTLDWIHETANRAEELGPFEWASGPLLLCTECVKIMGWYEQQTHWKHIQNAIDIRNLKALPPIFELYTSLEKSLRLAEFFGFQVISLMRNPDKDKQDLAEIKKCIVNNCNVITVIGNQISSLNVNSAGKPLNNRELILQRNIGQYCSFVVSELGCLFAINQEKQIDESTVTVNLNDSGDSKHRGVSVWDTIKLGFSIMFCRSARPTNFVNDTKTQKKEDVKFSSYK